ncbi:uncharacterized protein BJ171DRAFT_566139 [Polychytrium aggregatum]|uniref:uncharacterized protein n=1 Tax=Polychytrium aggregatum TaxID=110093 RepID=UPI0022FEE439|nr:uncharacterized protein BJ171DRAFT_566139 [Polychytrium aggregatum]KAI9207348.1 hypothetical protein BJ171DRAFT_566139 [Polychytrium aggregatum]
MSSISRKVIRDIIRKQKAAPSAAGLSIPGMDAVSFYPEPVVFPASSPSLPQPPSHFAQPRPERSDTEQELYNSLNEQFLDKLKGHVDQETIWESYEKLMESAVEKSLHSAVNHKRLLSQLQYLERFLTDGEHTNVRDPERIRGFFFKIRDRLSSDASYQTYLYLIKSYEEKGDVAKIKQTILEMKRRKLDIRSEIYNILVRTCIAVGDLDGARQVLLEVKALHEASTPSHISVDPSVYESLIKRLSASGRPDDCEDLLEDIPVLGIKPTSPMYNYSMMCMMKHRRYEDVVRWFQTVKNGPVQPTLSTFHMALIAYSHLSPKKAIQLFRSMQSSEGSLPKPDLHVLQTMAKFSIRTHNLDLALEVLDLIHTNPDFLRELGRGRSALYQGLVSLACKMERLDIATDLHLSLNTHPNIGVLPPDLILEPTPKQLNELLTSLAERSRIDLLSRVAANQVSWHQLTPEAIRSILQCQIRQAPTDPEAANRAVDILCSKTTHLSESDLNAVLSVDLVGLLGHLERAQGGESIKCLLDLAARASDPKHRETLYNSYLRVLSAQRRFDHVVRVYSLMKDDSVPVHDSNLIFEAQLQSCAASTDSTLRDGLWPLMQRVVLDDGMYPGLAGILRLFELAAECEQLNELELFAHSIREQSKQPGRRLTQDDRQRLQRLCDITQYLLLCVHHSFKFDGDGAKIDATQMPNELSHDEVDQLVEFLMGKVGLRGNRGADSPLGQLIQARLSA